MVTATLRGRAPADRLLPQGRLAGPMPWVIAIMVFLTVLATAAGIALQQGAATMGRMVANRLTVQVVDADAPRRDAAVARIAARLNAATGVTRVSVVPRDRLMAQLEPWLGKDLDTAEIPVPALIDVDLGAGAGEDAARRVAAAVAAVSPAAQVQPHATYLAPVAALVRTVGWIALGIVALMAFATASVVMLAARGAHASHRGTIDIMHMLGATDVQVMRLFQRRMTLDVSFGAVVGLVSALLLVLLVGRSAALLAGDLLQSIALPVWGWIVLPLLPCLFIVLAWIAARRTLQRALARSL